MKSIGVSQSVEEKIARHTQDGTVTSRFGFNRLKMSVFVVLLFQGKKHIVVRVKQDSVSNFSTCFFNDL